MENTNQPIDPKNGFDSLTKTFHPMRPPFNLPPEHLPLSTAAYALSLRRSSPWPDSVALISSTTSQPLYFSEFARRIKTLTANLQSVIQLSKGETAFLLTPNSIHVPIIYFSLLSLGVVISPANPTSTEPEIDRLIELSKPVIAFATSATAHKLKNQPIKIILIDSPEFESLTAISNREPEPVEVKQSDSAAIMYSSGTTGKVKGAVLTHRNLIAMLAGYHANRVERKSPVVILYTVPYFHMVGFFYTTKSIALGETVVVMERFEMRKMLRSVEEFRVTHVTLVPPLVVAMTKSHLTADYDLSSLETIACGTAPLGKEVIKKFKTKFPKVTLAQGYGLTEASGAVFRTAKPEETLRFGSTGRLSEGFEAKIIDPESGDALLPGKQGELWIRGPTIMKGYIGDGEATSATIVAGGWLRTGDLCYIDEEGYLYVVDRLKELIKYKGYQVAPAELEQLLLSHPEIIDAAVIPYPDEEAGEIPMAIVVKEAKSSLRESDVLGFVAKKVAPYKKVRKVAFVDSIPKTGSGKILRRELKTFVSSSFSRL
ncbi:hypothetical protein UlMin_045454 [Ulmus minor]